MQIYADRFPRAGRQLATDLIVVVWVYLWIRAASWLHDRVGELADAGRTLENAGTGLADNLADVGSRVGRVPLVGDELTGPFEQAAGAARSVAAAGQEQQDLVGELALVLAATMLVFPLGLVLFGWLPLRVRWIRRASAAARLRGVPAGSDLLALRALTTRPLGTIAALGPDVAAGWRRGDPAVTDALAELELRALGLRGRR
ncbi:MULTISPECIES: hypothetical protein [unclassified Solwaraspora]|mgnify:FL=1|uniref:hypothetical protein n=1 Tax=unclassified Solwaraspora TaxID=2627926 RepID=UPI00248C92B4|nr:MULTISPECIES: hypothetical protein [unclassified Solwaraspora]WBB95377.1 hypothetical protein O7553_18505 [Solwaraspora sp. WMMA2059]WBC20717.1 hypothetical protein O7543_28855 [Solwaraspora sp. WMMA2080]WJK37150.1 hypothetical protein O7610_12825 [Solwaraspora sp. WMMA2065]